MPVCPRCRDEYRQGVERCADCGVGLVPDGSPLPPRVDALLGTFDPRMAAEVVALLERRGIAHRGDEVAGGAVEVVVDREHRDDLRAELTLNWPELLRAVPAEEREGLSDGPQPGWHDPPRGAWVDAHGRLQVERTEEEERALDARRTVGPVLSILGGLLLVFGWWAGASELVVVAGLVLLGLGLLLPR